MRYALLYHDRAFYLFGGTSGSAAYSDKIVRLDAETGAWSEIGTLAIGRQGHGAIFDGNKFLIVGGYKSLGVNQIPYWVNFYLFLFIIVKLA